mmetsp:Transcript_51774/g.160391  ORF Transcript_51774/g.160391 Transcript_51774/m.160391 type:complete len:409 (-) Transcript_51774:64-1290(-)
MGLAGSVSVCCCHDLPDKTYKTSAADLVLDRSDTASTVSSHVGAAHASGYEPPWDNQLGQAVVAGDAARVRSLLAGDVSPNAFGPAGLTPLHLAALHGRAEVAQVLVEAAADICSQTADSRKLTPAAAALLKGHSKVYEVLWQADHLEAETTVSDSSSSCSDADSDGSMERYTCMGGWSRDRGCAAARGEMRMAYKLRRHGGFLRHLHMPGDFSVRESPDRELAYVLVPELLGAGDIAAVHAAGRQPSTVLCDDRAADLGFEHVAYRFEAELRARARHLYRRLLGVMVWADLLLWRSLSDYPKVYPEFEYIRYDGAATSKEYAIDPHVDNRSLVTLVCMLSQPSDFTGGTLGFQAAGDSESEGEEAGGRRERPAAGGAVIFRGEMLEHWVTPVTAGKRYVLQVELSSV